jgi:hypothetical protein
MYDKPINSDGFRRSKREGAFESVRHQYQWDGFRGREKTVMYQLNGSVQDYSGRDGQFGKSGVLPRLPCDNCPIFSWWTVASNNLSYHQNRLVGGDAANAGPGSNCLLEASNEEEMPDGNIYCSNTINYMDGREVKLDNITIPLSRLNKTGPKEEKKRTTPVIWKILPSFSHRRRSTPMKRPTLKRDDSEPNLR